MQLYKRSLKGKINLLDVDLKNKAIIKSSKKLWKLNARGVNQK